MRLADGSSQEEPGSLPPAGRCDIPADWGASLGADFRGRVEFRRRFNKPTGLENGERVFLVVARVDAFGRLSLNGAGAVIIPPGGDETRLEISGILRPHNELVIEVELPRLTDKSAPLPRAAGRQSQPGGLIGEVRLEIG